MTSIADNVRSELESALNAIAPFKRLESDRLRDLASRTTSERRREGSAIVTAGDSAADVVVLAEGEAEVWQDERLIGFVEAPIALGLAAHATERPHDATVRAASDVRVLRLPGDAMRALAGDPAWAPALIEALSIEIVALRDERREAIRSWDDGFDSPNARLVTGPYELDPFRAWVMIVETERAHLASLLPPGLLLLPGTGGRYLVVLSDFERASSKNPRSDGRTFAYRETTPFIPCFAGLGNAGGFIPELYPDSYMAILLGREIYGFPKRMGRTFLREGGADVIVDNARMLRARWGSPEAMDASSFAGALVGGLIPAAGFGGLVASLAKRAVAGLGIVPPAPRAFVRKQIASEAETHPRAWRVDELIEVPFELRAITSVERLRRHDVRFSPRQRILTGRVVDVFAIRAGFAFARGRRLRDYGRSPSDANGET